MRFTGTTVIITGAAGGLGSAMAAAFAAEGGRVAVVDLPGSGGAGVAEQISSSGAAGSAFFVPCDLADLDRTGEVIRGVAAGDGAGAVLFFCAPESSFITGQLLCVDGGWVMY
jgi:NAD(P)-dependent dehydrogenase (short-subunit alcohol dehydrogenase family)